MRTLFFGIFVNAMLAISVAMVITKVSLRHMKHTKAKASAKLAS